jgi:hypothetical protein
VKEFNQDESRQEEPTPQVHQRSLEAALLEASIGLIPVAAFTLKFPSLAHAREASGPKIGS